MKFGIKAQLISNFITKFGIKINYILKMEIIIWISIIPKPVTMLVYFKYTVKTISKPSRLKIYCDL